MSDANSTPERRVIYQGRKIDLALQPVKLSDGSIADREVVVHRGAVALLPLVDADHVCLLKNYRYTVGKTLWEVPALAIVSELRARANDRRRRDARRNRAS